MYFLTHLFRVCYFSTLIKLLSGYLLFAANLEDFHTIAKKIGAENFPKSFIKTPADKDDAASYEDADYERSFEMQQKSHHSNHKKHSNSKPRDAKIDFEELVERVKKRIEKELKEKYYIERDTEIITIHKNQKENDKNNNTHKQEVKKKVKETSPVDYDTEYVDEITNRPKKPFNKNEGLKGKIKKTTKAIVDENRSEYADATIEMTIKPKRNKQKSTYNDEFSFETVTYTYTDDNYMKNQEIRTTKNNFVSKEVENLPFKKIHMSKKDSYEDYKIPEKETNIYSSAEIKPQKKNEKRFNIKKQNRKKIVTKDMGLTTNNLKNRSKKTKLKKSTPNDKYIDKFIESEEIKAKTVYANDFDEIPSKENTKKVKYVTSKPTRERYKAVTPNYYAKLPTVVEKYDFNEPLPEKDRERENLKYYGNPPALINKKVRLL